MSMGREIFSLSIRRIGNILELNCNRKTNDMAFTTKHSYLFLFKTTATFVVAWMQMYVCGLAFIY